MESSSLSSSARREAAMDDTKKEIRMINLPRSTQDSYSVPQHNKYICRLLLWPSNNKTGTQSTSPSRAQNKTTPSSVSSSWEGRRRLRQQQHPLLLQTTLFCSYCFLSFCCYIPTVVHASQAAGIETLVGIVGRDFVLVGADCSVNRGYALTASNLDKIAVLVEPFPNVNGGVTDDDNDHHDNNDPGQDVEKVGHDGNSVNLNGLTTTPVPFVQRGTGTRQKMAIRQQAIVAAAAGDAADSDRLIGELTAKATIEEYENGWGCDVRFISPSSSSTTTTTDSALYGGGLDTMTGPSPGLDVKAMAHLARGRIASSLRSGTPLNVCLLIAGMTASLDDDDYDYDYYSGTTDGNNLILNGESSEIVPIEDTTTIQRTNDNFVALQVQKQLQQARYGRTGSNPSELTTSTSSPSDVTMSSMSTPSSPSFPSSPYRPRLYWLDEYGSLQRIQYGAHGYGSNFCLSILDRGYRPDMTRSQAIQLMNECFEQLRNRYVVNSPQDPCVKCIDVDGVHLIRPNAAR